MTRIGKQRLWGRYRALWQELSGWRLFLFYVLHYTLLFVLLRPLLFSAFNEAEKSLIWKSDALPQWCTYVVYLSQTIRDGIQSLLAGDGWDIPLYDFAWGPVEMDLRLEPIQLFAVFWPWDKIDILYELLIISRYYLIGISFSLFGFYFKQKPLPILIGSLSYAFCGFTLYAGVRHPFYMAAVIYVPLLTVGIEKVVRREKPFLLIFMVFIALATNIYFACMLALAAALYVLVRALAFYEQNRSREFAALIGRLVICIAIGTALSSVFMVPSLLQNIRTGRIGSDRLAYMDLLKYSKTYYQRFLSYFTVVPSGLGSWSRLGFSVLALPAVILLFVQRRREHRTLRVLFLLLTVMMLFPTVAYIMSGFDNISNRWCFIYAFLVCAILMFELPILIETDKKIFAFVGIGTIAYFYICYFVIEHGYYRENAMVLLIIAMLLLIICRTLESTGRKLALPLCLVITCLSIYNTAYLLYDSSQDNYVSEFVTQGGLYDTYKQSHYGSFAKSKVSNSDDSFYRVSYNGTSRDMSNLAFYYGINGISGYSAYYYSDYWNWNQELELSQLSGFGVFLGLDGRAPMLTLDSVKYYVMRKTGSEYMPYGFREIERIKNETKTDVILENEFALPIGYTYDSYLSLNEYGQLGALGKQEAQLQAVLLNKAPSSSEIEKASVVTTGYQIPATISEMENLTWKNGKLKIEKENASITLSFNGIPKAETYLRVVDFDLTSGSSTRLWTITAKTDTTSAKAHFRSDAYVYANGMKTQLLNLGYSEDGYTTCTITFPSKGTCRLEDLQIWCQPMDNYGDQINALREEALENVDTNWRGLTGTISVSKDKILCISVPYSDGWTAYIDGKKTEILQANTAFMGLELEAGNHIIELRYWTPGLTIGIVLSALGVFGAIGMIAYWRKKEQRQETV